MHDLHHGVAGFVVKFDVPEILKPIVIGLVVHPLVVGKHHGNQTGVAGTLHIVLAAQRVQPRARLANLARHRCQRNQAARIVSTVHMLADAHAPQNHRAFGFGKFTRHFTQRLGWNTADRCHGFGAIGLDVFFQCFKITGTLGNEIIRYQPFLNHRIDQRIKHGNIGIGLELQRTPSVFADVCDARVSQHNFCAALCGVFHPGGSHRMVGGRVRANDKNQIRMLNIIDLVADCARAYAFEQGRHAGRMAQTGAVVYVVAAKANAYQFLKQIGFFIAALGRAKTSQRLFTVRVAQIFERAAT